MINNDYNYEFESDEEDLDEEDLIIQAAAAAAIAVGLCVMGYAQALYDKKRHHSHSSGMRTPHTTALDGVKENLHMVANSLRELASESEHKLRRRQLDTRADDGHEQEGKAESAQQHRYEAMQRVQQIETHLDDSRLTALADLVGTDTNAADIYISMEREDYRHAWVALKLKEMGFVEGISI